VFQNGGISEAIKFSPSPKPITTPPALPDARGHDLIRFIGREQQHHVRAFDLLEGAARGFHERDTRRLMMLCKMHDGFRIRFRGKVTPSAPSSSLISRKFSTMPLCTTTILPVCQDADERCERWRTVSCPARMTNARRAGQRGFGDQVHQLG
jgi:hypothetical protein